MVSGHLTEEEAESQISKVPKVEGTAKQCFNDIWIGKDTIGKEWGAYYVPEMDLITLQVLILFDMII